MCGIVGYVGHRPAAPLIIEALQRLEYRGYDSAGLAILDADGNLAVRKRAGKLEELACSLQGSLPQGNTGVGHTRWATHGRPNDLNAHPHSDCRGEVVVVHNGIIESHHQLKEGLKARGHRFLSETDSEIIAHLMEEALGRGLTLAEALRQAMAVIQGAHAVVAMARSCPGKIVGARVGNAGGLVVGVGQNEAVIASDLPAILPFTRHVVFLNDGEMVEAGPEGVALRSLATGALIERTAVRVPYDPVSVAKGPYKHFMLKEMMEQPEAILDTLRGRVDLESLDLHLEGVDPSLLKGVERVVLVGMGTSLHAAMVGRHYVEQIARLPAEWDNASEFRYRDPILDDRVLVIAVSQSGETADTLAAMVEARRKGARLVAVCNVVGSQATRMADGVVYTRCGLEIGVCSTKTFTASLVALYLLVCALATSRQAIDRQALGQLLLPMARLPYLVGELTKRSHEYEALAHAFAHYQNFLYLGRGIQYPIALEGALKLKEVSYIHAEGYPAGEMKHGPIALIDQNMPVMAIALRDELWDKMRNNMEQVRARDGTIIAVATEGDEEVQQLAHHTLWVPPAPTLLSPILTVIPLQFFAYHIAVRRGCDVDQPRNLAKTVTVE